MQGQAKAAFQLVPQLVSSRTVKCQGEIRTDMGCSQSAGGHCCARDKEGRYGMDVRKGLGREDCGYCFTGYCEKS